MFGKRDKEALLQIAVDALSMEKNACYSIGTIADALCIEDIPDRLAFANYLIKNIERTGLTRIGGVRMKKSTSAYAYGMTDCGNRQCNRYWCNETDLYGKHYMCPLKKNDQQPTIPEEVS